MQLYTALRRSRVNGNPNFCLIVEACFQQGKGLVYDRDNSSLRRASFGLWTAQGQSTPGLRVSLWESKRANHTHNEVRVPSGGQRASTHQSCSKNFLCKLKSWFDAGLFLKRAALLSMEVQPEPAGFRTVLRHKPWKIRTCIAPTAKRYLKHWWCCPLHQTTLYLRVSWGYVPATGRGAVCWDNEALPTCTCISCYLNHSSTHQVPQLHSLEGTGIVWLVDNIRLTQPELWPNTDQSQSSRGPLNAGGMPLRTRLLEVQRSSAEYVDA